MIGFTDATCVHPEVFEAVFIRLSATKLKFGVTSLARAKSVLEIVEGDLIFIHAPREAESFCLSCSRLAQPAIPKESFIHMENAILHS